MVFDPAELLDQLSLHEQAMIKEITDISQVNSDYFRGSHYLVEMDINVNNGATATIFVGFKDNYPSSLPLFFDLKNVFGRIPHKETDGFLCFTRSETIVTDKRYPLSFLLNCLEKVIDLIEKGVNEENNEDFYLEFEAYWRHITKGNIHAEIDTDNKNIRELNLWYESDENTNTLIASEKSLNQTGKIIESIFRMDISQQERHRCIYIPLDKTIMPPASDEETGYSFAKNIFNHHLSRKSREKFRKVMKRKNKTRSNIEFVIFGLSLSNGNTALFAFGMTGTTVPYLHPLEQKPKGVQAVPLSVDRWHPKYLLNRTGGNIDLINKHIVIIGAGSVGSEIATRFAKAGIQELTVIDSDVMELENVYRHTLGNDSVYIKNQKDQLINVSKVTALKTEIESKYPFAQVTPLRENINDVLSNELLNWKSIDLVAVAIGSANLEMDINEQIHSMKYPPPTIYAWNEPLGIGGHTLITLNNNKTGCYECLFKPIEDHPIHNRSSFTKPNQDFSKDLTGCGSVYVPYSFLDSEKTAMLATENALKLLTGKLEDNPLLSWKGDAGELKSQGFETSNRYEFDEQQLYDSRFLYKDDKCPICGGKG